MQQFCFDVRGVSKTLIVPELSAFLAHEVVLDQRIGSFIEVCFGFFMLLGVRGFDISSLDERSSDVGDVHHDDSVLLFSVLMEDFLLCQQILLIIRLGGVEITTSVEG